MCVCVCVCVCVYVCVCVCVCEQTEAYNKAPSAFPTAIGTH